MVEYQNRKKIVLVIFFIGLILVSTDAYALFELNVDNFTIDFGFMNIGQTKELMERGSYQNEITCRSDNGNIWHLKIHLLDPLKSGTNYIPLSDFEWKVTSVINGDGVAYNQGAFNSFLDIPSLTYTSGPGDGTGRDVRIRFDYRLTVPKNQPSGNYRTILRYTVTEIL